MQWSWMPSGVHFQAQASPRERAYLPRGHVQESRRNHSRAGREGCALLSVNPACKEDEAAGSEHAHLRCWSINPEAAFSIVKALARSPCGNFQSLARMRAAASAERARGQQELRSVLRLEFPYHGLVHQAWEWHPLPGHSIRLKYQWK